MRVAVAAIAAGAAVAAAGPAVSSAQAAVGDATVTFSDPGEFPFQVPDGVTVIHVDAIGGSGQSNSRDSIDGTGGRGEEVSGSFAVTPGQGLYVEVGVGGGSASMWGGAGGGASAIEKCPTSTSFCAGFASALNSRYLVAGGGGGGGLSFPGGNAGAAGSDGGAVSCAGLAGGPGTDSAGGAGGTGGSTAANGADGTFGAGGAGGFDGQDLHPGGGGGGGGWWGGGGGGGGSCGNANASPYTGGGGGGSSYAAANVGSVVSGPASQSAPSVTITYTDHVAPTVTLTAPTSGQTLGGSPEFSGAASHGGGDSQSVSIPIYAGDSVSGSPVTTLTAQRDQFTGAYSVTPPSALANGVYTAQAVQSDAAGNVGTSTPVTFTVYVPAPPAPPAGPGAAQPGPGGSGAAATVSSQAARCVVPRLTGLTLARARARLTAAGCRVGHVSRRHAPRHGAVVVKQGSRAGATRGHGSRISLVLGPRHRPARHHPKHHHG